MPAYVCDWISVQGLHMQTFICMTSEVKCREHAEIKENGGFIMIRYG